MSNNLIFSIFQCGIENFATRFFLVAREKCYKEHHGLMQFLSKPEQDRWYTVATIQVFF